MEDFEDAVEEFFGFFIPITGSYVGDELSKAVSSRAVKGINLRWIEGLASTEDVDLQNESVDQKGIDFSYVIDEGYFNDDHKPGPGHKLGEPTEIDVKTAEHPITGKKQYGLFVKGFLYNNKVASDEYWELLKAQETTPGSKRRVGFSIQGKVKKRFGHKVLSCWVQDIALTTAPINTNTWSRIVKSFMVKSITCNHRNSLVCTGCNGDCKNSLNRSLDVSYSSKTGGGVIVPQSLDKDLFEPINREELVGLLKKMNKSEFPQESISKFVDIIYEVAERMGGVNV